MWLTTSIGFFSIVNKPGETDLTVRSRVKGDLEELQRRYVPSLGSIDEGGGTDYPFRAHASREAIAAGVSRMVEDVRYPNFKDEVADRQGHERAQIYVRVWSVLRDLTLRTNP
jgi:hypothetical protein